MSSTCKTCLSSNQTPTMHCKITDRITQPTPEEVREARERAGFTQGKAAELVSAAKKAGYKTWGAYELSAITEPSGYSARLLGAFPASDRAASEHPSGAGSSAVHRRIRRVKLQDRYLNRLPSTGKSGYPISADQNSG